LLAILNDILDVSRLETGVWQLVEREVDFNRVVDSVARMVLDRTTKAGLSLEISCDTDLAEVLADERMVRQMLLNLLSNAAKFTPEQGTISVQSMRNDAGETILRVSDTGVGIAEENFEKILMPFGQVENALSRSTSGTGLGLSLVKSMIELHGGEIRIESVPDEGTSFSLVFPASRSAASRADGQAAE
jgi:two-component system cell cycle sensor histidine kinase PleC